MKKFVCGFNLNRLRRLTEPKHKPPFTAKELARLGIPAGKIVRLQQELARLQAGDPALTRADLLALATPLAAQLPATPLPKR